MKTFSELKKNIKRDFSGFKQIRVAVLGDFKNAVYLIAKILIFLTNERYTNRPF